MDLPGPGGPERVPPATGDAETRQTAGVALPTEPEALAATRARLPGKLLRLTPTLALPDGSVVLAWSQTTGEYRCDADVVLVRLSQASDGRWTARDIRSVLSASTPWLGEDEPPPLAVTLAAEDFDDDGDVEVRVRTRREIMCPGGGPNTVTVLQIYNVVPSFGVALMTELHHSMEAQPEVQTSAKLRHLDVNGDGHRDVQIDYTTTSDGASVQARNRWHFDPSADRWLPHDLGTQAFDCDW